MNLPIAAALKASPGATQHPLCAQVVQLQLLRHYAHVIQLLADELLGMSPALPPLAAPVEVAREPAPPVDPSPVDSEASREALTFLQTRSLADDPVVALWLGGLQVRGVHWVFCLGAPLLGYRLYWALRAVPRRIFRV